MKHKIHVSDTQNQRGSLLIELSILLIIVGTLFVVSYPFYEIYRQQNAVNITQKRIEVVSKALSAYAQMRWRLPCPASSKIEKDVVFGQERQDCSSIVSDAHGIIPYYTLGIPKQYVRDGYGNFFTYVVSPNFTVDNRLSIQEDMVNARLAHFVGGDENEDENSNDDGYYALLPTAQFCAPLKNDGTDIIVYHDGIKFFPKALRSIKNIPRITNPNANLNRDKPFITVSMALISHGKNGRGAYQLDGSQFSGATIASAEEATSSNMNRIIKIESKNSGFDEGGYDDIISFLTQNDLFALGGNSCDYL